MKIDEEGLKIFFDCYHKKYFGSRINVARIPFLIVSCEDQWKTWYSPIRLIFPEERYNNLSDKEIIDKFYNDLLKLTELG